MPPKKAKAPPAPKRTLADVESEYREKELQWERRKAELETELFEVRAISIDNKARTSTLEILTQKEKTMLEVELEKGNAHRDQETEERATARESREEIGEKINGFQMEIESRVEKLREVLSRLQQKKQYYADVSEVQESGEEHICSPQRHRFHQAPNEWVKNQSREGIDDQILNAGGWADAASSAVFSLPSSFVGGANLDSQSISFDETAHPIPCRGALSFFKGTRSTLGGHFTSNATESVVPPSIDSLARMETLFRSLSSHSSSAMAFDVSVVDPCSITRATSLTIAEALEERLWYPILQFSEKPQGILRHHWGTVVTAETVKSHEGRMMVRFPTDASTISLEKILDLANRCPFGGGFLIIDCPPSYAGSEIGVAAISAPFLESPIVLRYTSCTPGYGFALLDTFIAVASKYCWETTTTTIKDLLLQAVRTALDMKKFLFSDVDSSSYSRTSKVFEVDPSFNQQLQPATYRPHLTQLPLNFPAPGSSYQRGKYLVQVRVRMESTAQPDLSQARTLLSSRLSQTLQRDALLRKQEVPGRLEALGIPSGYQKNILITIGNLELSSAVPAQVDERRQFFASLAAKCEALLYAVDSSLSNQEVKGCIFINDQSLSSAASSSPDTTAINTTTETSGTATPPSSRSVMDLCIRLDESRAFNPALVDMMQRRISWMLEEEYQGTITISPHQLTLNMIFTMEVEAAAPHNNNSTSLSQHEQISIESFMASLMWKLGGHIADPMTNPKMEIIDVAFSTSVQSTPENLPIFLHEIDCKMLSDFGNQIDGGTWRGCLFVAFPRNSPSSTSQQLTRGGLEHLRRLLNLRRIQVFAVDTSLPIHQFQTKHLDLERLKQCIPISAQEQIQLLEKDSVSIVSIAYEQTKQETSALSLLGSVRLAPKQILEIAACATSTSSSQDISIGSSASLEISVLPAVSITTTKLLMEDVIPPMNLQTVRLRKVVVRVNQAWIQPKLIAHIATWMRRQSSMMETLIPDGISFGFYIEAVVHKDFEVHASSRAGYGDQATKQTDKGWTGIRKVVRSETRRYTVGAIRDFEAGGVETLISSGSQWVLQVEECILPESPFCGRLGLTLRLVAEVPDLPALGEQLEDQQLRMRRYQSFGEERFPLKKFAELLPSKTRCLRLPEEDIERCEFGPFTSFYGTNDVGEAANYQSEDPPSALDYSIIPYNVERDGDVDESPGLGRQSKVDLPLQGTWLMDEVGKGGTLRGPRTKETGGKAMDTELGHKEQKPNFSSANVRVRSIAGLQSVKNRLGVERADPFVQFVDHRSQQKLSTKAADRIEGRVFARTSTQRDTLSPRWSESDPSASVVLNNLNPECEEGCIELKVFDQGISTFQPSTQVFTLGDLVELGYSTDKKRGSSTDSEGLFAAVEAVVAKCLSDF